MTSPRRYTVVLLIALLFAASPAFASADEYPVSSPNYGPANLDAPPEQTPIEEWALMTSKQREERVSLAIGLVEKHGAIVMKNTYEYLNKVDQRMKAGYNNEDKNLDTAILHVIYENEPQTHAAIKAMFNEYPADAQNPAEPQ